MSKFEKDPLFEEKFICFKSKHAQECLTNEEQFILSILLQKIDRNFPNHEYLCVNQDEQYAEQVWELIKQNELSKM